MIDFTPFASSSHGNLYTVTSGDDTLLIECGLPIKDIRKALNFKLSSVCGCLLTHEHGDHSKAAKDTLKAGVDIYTSLGTAAFLDLSGHRLHTIKAGTQFRVGPFTILPFMTQHDCTEPLGFLITDGEDKLMFATDTHYLKWKFNGLTMIAIECNYADDLLGDLDPVRRNRLIQSHMSLDTVKKLLQANDLSRVEEITLLHLSNEHSDAPRFKREIQQLTGIPAYIAGEK